jgi:hypothetical protein
MEEGETEMSDKEKLLEIELVCISVQIEKKRGFGTIGIEKLVEKILDIINEGPSNER